MKKRRPKIAAIVLAAGRSSRLRRPKQLVIYRGMTLIQRTVFTALFSQASEVIVVLGAFQRRISRELKHLDVKTVRNITWYRGQGASIKAGVRYALENSPDIDGFLFLLCDQPLVNEDMLDRLIDTFDAQFLQTDCPPPIVVSSYQDSLGVPAIFSKHYAQEILDIDDDGGAKSVIMNNFSAVSVLSSDLLNIDIDTPEDLQKLLLPHMVSGVVEPGKKTDVLAHV